MSEFRQTLNSLSWENVTSCNDANFAFNEFFETFIDLFNLYFPLRTVKFNKNTMGINNFMTKGLLISRAQKNKLHYIYLTNQTETNFSLYRKYRNIFNTTLKLSKKLTIENRLQKNKHRPRKLWDVFNELTTGKKTKNNNCNELIVNGKTINGESEIAHEFNDFFSSIGNRISKSIPHTNIKPTTLIKNRTSPPPPKI